MKNRRLRKATRLAVIITVTVLAIIVGWIQTSQRMVRRHAEIILRDLQAVVLRQTSYEEMQGMLSRWPTQLEYQGDCSAGDCGVEAIICDTSRLHPRFLEKPAIFWIYTHMGGRLSRVRAKVNFRQHRVWGKSFTVEVMVPATPNVLGGYPYPLIGDAGTVTEFLPFGRKYPEHPEYRVGWPSSCSICVMIQANFTAFADPADVRRLMDLNLSCLTSWEPCREKADIMPAAWQQAQADRQLWEKSETPGR